MIHQERARKIIIAITTLEFATLSSLQDTELLTTAVAAILAASDHNSCLRPKEETRPEGPRATKAVWPPRKIAEIRLGHLAGGLQMPSVNHLSPILIISLHNIIKTEPKAKTPSLWTKTSLHGAPLHRDNKMMTEEICAEALRVE